MSDEISGPVASIQIADLGGDTKVGDELHVHEHGDHSHLLNVRHLGERGTAMRFGSTSIIEEKEDGGRIMQVGDEVIETDAECHVTEVIRVTGRGPSRVNSRAYRNNYDAIFGKKEGN